MRPETQKLLNQLLKLKSSIQIDKILDEYPAIYFFLDGTRYKAEPGPSLHESRDRILTYTPTCKKFEDEIRNS